MWTWGEPLPVTAHPGGAAPRPARLPSTERHAAGGGLAAAPHPAQQDRKECGVPWLRARSLRVSADAPSHLWARRFTSQISGRRK